MLCTSTSLTNTYHVTCANGTNPPYYVYDSIITATGQSGALKNCPGTITASVYNSQRGSTANSFAAVATNYTSTLGVCSQNGGPLCAIT
jgi:hypothetical protein